MPLQLPEYHNKDPPVPIVPPEAVNVVELPVQIVVVPEIVVGAEDKELTVMVIEFEVAGLPTTQVALDVNTQVITLPLVKDEVT